MDRVALCHFLVRNEKGRCRAMIRRKLRSGRHVNISLFRDLAPLIYHFYTSSNLKVMLTLYENDVEWRRASSCLANKAKMARRRKASQ
jgi:hypothetical protein